MSTDLTFSQDPDAQRYEARSAGELVGYVVYRTTGPTMIIASTVTLPAHRGHGYAGALTRYVLDDLRARGWRVVPRCPFTADWIDRHPDYAALLTG